MASRGREENRPRSSDERHPSVAARIGRALSSSFRRSPPRSAPAGVPEGVPGFDERYEPLIFCHSCGDRLSTRLAEQCRSCGELSHSNCFAHYGVAEHYSAFMCDHCGSWVQKTINTIESVMERTSLTWETDKWWLNLVDLVKHDHYHEHAGNNARHELELFLMKALRHHLVWKKDEAEAISDGDQDDPMEGPPDPPQETFKREPSLSQPRSSRESHARRDEERSGRGQPSEQRHQSASGNDGGRASDRAQDDQRSTAGVAPPSTRSRPNAETSGRNSRNVKEEITTPVGATSTRRGTRHYSISSSVASST